MEMNSAMIDKSDTFTIRDVPCLKDLLDQVSGSGSADVHISMEEQAVKRQSADLQESEFKLLLKHIEYDCKVWRVYESKVSNHEKAMYWKKQDYNLKRHKMCCSAADEFIRSNTCVINSGEVNQIFKAYQQLQKSIAVKHHIDQKDVVTIAIVNWVAPCSINSQALDLQANLIGMLAGANEKNIMPVLLPQFAYKKGQLYLTEQMVTNLLATRGLNFDHKFGLLFADRVDSRDNRLLIYDGRIVVPFGCKDDEYYFRNCELMKGRTEPAAMVKSSMLQCIEDTSEKALPATTDADGHVKGAAKYAQIGQDGMEKLLDALLTGVSIDNRTAIILYEINAGWGNLFDAYLAKRPGWNFPAYYMTHAEDVIQYEWLLLGKRDLIKHMHLDGKLSVPGYPVLPESMPTDLLEEPPPVPSLNKLIAAPAKTSGGNACVKVMLPDVIVKLWYNHALFGDDFQAKV